MASPDAESSQPLLDRLAEHIAKDAFEYKEYHSELILEALQTLAGRTVRHAAQMVCCIATVQVEGVR